VQSRGEKYRGDEIEGLSLVRSMCSASGGSNARAALRSLVKGNALGKVCKNLYQKRENKERKQLKMRAIQAKSLSGKGKEGIGKPKKKRGGGRK